MEEIRHTYCRICESKCGLKVTVRDGKLVHVAGDKDHPISKGYICPRGLATLDINQDPDRLTHPRRRDGGEWRDVSWESALGDIGRKLREIRRIHGRDAVGVYFGNPIAFDYALSAYVPLAMQTMGSCNYFSAGSQDCNNKFAAAERIFGSPLIHPIPDVDHMDFLIIWGSNPAVSKMSFVSLSRPEPRLKDIEKRGGRVIIIDPRRTETVKQLGEHIFIRPGTDVFMMLAMLDVIIGESLYDRMAVERHTSGLDELKRMAAKFPPRVAAKITGVPEEVIATLARDFAAAKNAGIHCSVGINQGRFATLGSWLVQCLNGITGRLDKAGSMLFAQSPVNFPRLYQLGMRFKKEQPSRIGGFRPVMGTKPGGIMADEILTQGPGQVKALIVLCGNPLLTVPDTEKLERAFKSLDLLVCIDLYTNETGGLAHYVLPSQDMYEHWDFAAVDLMFNPVRFLKYTDAVANAEGERREIWRIFHDVLMAAGYPFGGNALTGIGARIADGMARLLGRPGRWSFQPKLMLQALLAMSGSSIGKLKKNPHGLILGSHRTGDFFSRRIMTKDKRLNLAPPEFMAEENALIAFMEQAANGQRLLLINQRQNRTHNSWFHNVPGFSERMQTNRVSIHPEDAAARGIADGDMVTVAGPGGSIRLPALLTNDLMPGVASIPHGWGHDRPSGLSRARNHPGVNVNTIMASGPDALEKFAGQAILTGVPITIEKK